VLDTIDPSGTVNVPIFTTGSPVAARRFVPVTSMTSSLPPTALDGLNPVILGATLKIAVLVPVPIALATLTGPVRAPVGTTTCRDLAVTPVGTAVMPPVNVTSAAPAMFAPLIVTVAPTAAVAGTNAVTFGGWITARSVALSAVPSTVVTPIFPVTAPRGTGNRTSVGVLETIDPGGTTNAPIFTVGVPVTARRLVPLTTTSVALPAVALPGAKPVIFGSTLKSVMLGPTPT